MPDFWHRLMWIVIGHHVPSIVIGGEFSIPLPVCFFATQYTLFDANTGQELEQSTGG
jgi:hypothetical protein